MGGLESTPTGYEKMSEKNVPRTTLVTLMKEASDATEEKIVFVHASNGN